MTALYTQLALLQSLHSWESRHEYLLYRHQLCAHLTSNQAAMAAQLQLLVPEAQGNPVSLDSL